ncbi:hypothetical protein AVEN_172599-1 [Araneus ventricosus]|uniref:Uncharacterized protein n=1 Tax=Araneus ventricosus TaxID=182803 RepID=A0A4Y2T049_ARAVE|nr:hypothetical protein AVEN_172599-1 [Araneus ventricosus]
MLITSELKMIHPKVQCTWADMGEIFRIIQKIAIPDSVLLNFSTEGRSKVTVVFVLQIKEKILFVAAIQVRGGRRTKGHRYKLENAKPKELSLTLNLSSATLKDPGFSSAFHSARPNTI